MRRILVAVVAVMIFQIVVLADSQASERARKISGLQLVSSGEARANGLFEPGQNSGETVAPAIDEMKSKLLPVTTPYCYVSQKSWDDFYLYVVNGGKWIKLNFYYVKGVQNQYFEAYEGDKLVLRGLISGAKGNKNFFPGVKPTCECHNHLGLYDVWFRSVKQRSRKYDCWMYWGLFYYRDHGIHAALKSGLPYMGSPDSHGCDRVYPETAKKLYKWAAKDPVKVLTVCDKT